MVMMYAAVDRMRLGVLLCLDWSVLSEIEFSLTDEDRDSTFEIMESLLSLKMNAPWRATLDQVKALELAIRELLSDGISTVLAARLESGQTTRLPRHWHPFQCSVLYLLYDQGAPGAFSTAIHLAIHHEPKMLWYH